MPHRSDSIAGAVVELAEHDRRFGAYVTHMPGTGVPAENPTEPAEHVFPSDFFRQLIGRLDAILQGQNRGFLTEQRFEERRDLGHLPGFDAEDHEVNRPDTGRILDHLRRTDAKVPGDAVDAKSSLPQRRSRVTASDEGHVLSGASQGSAEVATDRSNSENSDAQAVGAGPRRDQRCSPPPEDAAAGPTAFARRSFTVEINSSGSRTRKK